MRRSKRIVVSGIGPVASPGIGKDEFWKGILQTTTNVREIETRIDKNIWKKYFLHKVENFDILKFNIDKESLQSIRQWKEGYDNKDLYYALGACKLALDDSNIDYSKSDSNLGLVVCHENPGIEQLLWKSFESAYTFFKKNYKISKIDFFEKIYKSIMKLSYETQSFMFLFHIARTFKIHNFSLYVNNACSSGIYALDVASDMIQFGKAEKVLIVASDCPDVFKHIWFKDLKMYADDGLTKPFSENPNGFVLGEAAAALVLEEYEVALKRGATIYAEYLGSGFRLESWGITTPKLGYQYYHEAIEQSLINSNINKSEVNLICAHGVGTHINDYYEAKAFEEIFNDKVLVTAFKPYVGHCLGASNLIELIILLLCIKNQMFIPIINLDQMNPKIKLNLQKKQERGKIDFAIKASSAFAGFCASCVFKHI